MLNVYNVNENDNTTTTTTTTTANNDNNNDTNANNDNDNSRGARPQLRRPTRASGPSGSAAGCAPRVVLSFVVNYHYNYH